MSRGSVEHMIVKGCLDLVVHVAFPARPKAVRRGHRGHHDRYSKAKVAAAPVEAPKAFGTGKMILLLAAFWVAFFAFEAVFGGH